LDGFGFGAVGKKHRYILLDRALQQQISEGLRLFGLLADNDSAGVEVVVQSLTFAQKLGAEHDVQVGVLLPELFRITHRHRGFDDQRGAGVDLPNGFYHRFDAARVEVITSGVVVGRGGDDDPVGVGVGLLRVSGRGEAGRTAAVDAALGLILVEQLLNVGVFDRGDTIVELIYLGLDDVHGGDFVVLCQEYGQGEADIAGAGYGDDEGGKFFYFIDLDLSF